MRIVLFLLVILIVSACNGINNAGEGMASSPAPVLPDLTVSHVQFWWSEQWECGVDVHVTIQNLGDVDVGEFHISLHDRRELVLGVPANSQTTLVIPVDGQDIQRWMRATGTIDADNVIVESDEENNSYDKTLPYSAVPGMDSIAVCYLEQTPPAHTPTPTHHQTDPPIVLT